jgi:hypothetical protein
MKMQKACLRTHLKRNSPECLSERQIFRTERTEIEGERCITDVFTFHKRSQLSLAIERAPVTEGAPAS